MWIFCIFSYLFSNPNTFTGLVGKVQKNYLPNEEGREGGEKERVQRARRAQARGTCRVLGEAPQLHAMGVV